MLLLVNTSIYRHIVCDASRLAESFMVLVYVFFLHIRYQRVISILCLPVSVSLSLSFPFSICLILSLSVSFIHPSSSFTIVKISFIASNNANNGNESMCPKNVTIHLYAGLLCDWKQSDSRAFIGRCNCSCNLWLYIKMNYVLLFFNMRCKSIFLWKFFLN